MFYVGKGRGSRYKNVSQRNQYFKNYYNKYNCKVRKVKTGLDEDTAFQLEIYLIKDYRNKNQCQCNLADGGEGATYPEGSWNYYFRKLQYLHDVKHAMDDMWNESDYEYLELKNKTLDELIFLYQDYIEFKKSNETYNNLVYDEFGNVNEGWEHVAIKDIRLNHSSMMELAFQSDEITILTKMRAEKISRDNIEFYNFLNCKSEVDFLCLDMDINAFLSLIIEDKKYLLELLIRIMNNLKLIKLMGKDKRFNLDVKIESFFLDDSFVFIKTNKKEEKRNIRVKVDIRDIVWGILMFEDKPLFQLIYDEILASPII